MNRLLLTVVIGIVVFTAGAALQAHFDRDANRYYDEVIGHREARPQ